MFGQKDPLDLPTRNEDFYAKLNSFDNDSDDDEDEQDTLLTRALKRRKTDPTTGVRPETVQLNVAHAPGVQTCQTAAMPREGEVLAGSQRGSDSDVNRTTSDTTNPNSRTAQSLDASKPAKRLFEDFVFYFIPNDDVNKVRKRRIQNSQRQGATWARELTDSITHVICEQDVEAAGVKRVLKGKIDFSKVPVISNQWLIECLDFKDVRDVRQGRFQIPHATDLFEYAMQTTQHKTVPQPVNVLDQDDSAPPICEAQSVQVVGPDFNARSIETALPHTESSDDFSKIIRELQTTKCMPFDEDADIDLTLYISSTSGDEDESADFASKKITNVPNMHRGYACMEPSVGPAVDNPNIRTMEVLQAMATYYDTTGDKWRTFAYRKAIRALRYQKKRITTYQEAKAIDNIGDRIAQKIEEIVTTDHLARLDAIKEDSDEQVLQLFMTIYDVGLAQARRWLNQGYRTLEDLKTKATLSPNQRIGIDHHDDFAQRIPHDEVAGHGVKVQQALKQADEGLVAIIGGSFRRGKPDSGDIDILIAHPDADLPKLRHWVFNETVPQLFQTGFLKCALATSRSRFSKTEITPDKTKLAKPSEYKFAPTDSSGTKFLGASQLNPNLPWRRIDLLLVPSAHFGASLLYFTGNDIFNRSMRLLASRKGMRLNQYGLYKNVLRGPSRSKETEGELVEGRSERKIFDLLGVPWKEPHDRNC